MDAEGDRLWLGRLKQDAPGKLERHEAHLMRQLNATRAKLSGYQAARPAREAGPLKL